MDRSDVILGSGFMPASPDLESAKRAFRMLRGKVAVECDEHKGTYNDSILLPDEVMEKERPDTGTVISENLAYFVKDNRAHKDLHVGDRVHMAPYTGKTIENARIGSYSSNGWVRMFGIATEQKHAMANEVVLEPYDEVVVSKMVGTEIVPTGKNVLIARDAKKEMIGGIYLPDDEKYRDHRGVIQAIGPHVTEVSVGQTVVYHAGGILDYSFYRPGWALIREENIYCVIENED